MIGATALSAVIYAGFGVLVGPQRTTAARYGLSGVLAVLDWLEAVAAQETDR